ncbi:polysaccharide pyruvyl transferase family protein [Thioalkalivibrio versutus]|uniref:polysaccharide pyruvyl transferase family protein n=1 Tax=Thioalkalivibrio versutus TaxID=106634 RepID=UPI000984EC6A|nr:polysaccharide pyruvyl transferase family protein [Thioalkalivibrio versutus]OOC50950.1 hypothetical protein B0684_01385 [Thioalkalivibrio versutus]
MYTIANIRPLGHNVGNHAIHFALRQMLHDTFGRLVSVIDYPATSKHESTAKAGLTPETVHELNRYADGVIVGGGNLYENDEIAVDSRALAALQPPLLLFSNSRGRIYDRNGVLSDRSDVIPDQKIKTLLTRANMSLSRDSATHRYLRHFDDRDKIAWCPTINMARYTHLLPALPENENVGVLISVRTPELMNLPYRFQSRIQSHLESAIDHLRASGHSRIRLLCNDSRDLDFATSFRYSMNVDSIYTNDVYQYLSLLQSADLVVSYRLHATLPAVSFGTPTINIIYDERSQSLIDDLGMTTASLNVVELDNEFIPEMKTWIDRGGYSSLDHAPLQDDWKSKSDIQFAKLQEFKSLMDTFMKNGVHLD